MPHQAHAETLGSATAGAFEQLYNDYRPAVTRYLLGMGGDPLLAEELAQETFVRAAASLLLFRGEFDGRHLAVSHRTQHLFVVGRAPARRRDRYR